MNPKSARRLLPGLALSAFALAGCSEAAGSQSKPAATAAPAAASAECGTKGRPDCPLQGWMKATVQPYLNAGDHQRLAASLDELGKHAPPGYDGWAAAANAGAAAARAGDVAGVRAQCKACHEQNRGRYREEMRGARFF